VSEHPRSRGQAAGGAPCRPSEAAELLPRVTEGARPATLVAMTTRSIVTSQPDVACDVCQRRLLRGEQPDYFIADGQRRLVCELCAPRAAHEGWLRATDAAAEVTLPPMRPRRGRSLLDRVIAAARGTGGEGPASGERGERGRRTPRKGAPATRSRHEAGAEEPYDLFAAPDGAPQRREGEAAGEDGGGETAAHLGEDFAYLGEAVVAFNASEYPRRVAGVARSLGEPVVSVRSAEHLESIVRIVVAWELCWYRYEVDTGEAPVFAQAVGQGTELDQLAREEREGNALADRSGRLKLAQ
jgi:hypothetical protein